LTFSFVVMSWAFFRSASFNGAVHMLEGLTAWPLGHGLGGWRTIAVAAFCAIALPPSHEIARRLTEVARPSVAVALAALGVAVAAQLGRIDNYEFIYFQF
jgi:hypothetical protein